jgi:DNA-directed RNA polymerase specialized sigma24 family protein
MRLLHNAHIQTLNPDQPVATAIAIDHGRILAVGSSQELLAHLTTAQSIAVRLSFVGYSHAEIGVALGVSRRAISYRVERARTRLERFSEKHSQNASFLTKCSREA